MQPITQKAIQKLAQHKNQPAVSIFMPMRARGSPGTAQDKFHHLLSEAKASLSEWLPDQEVSDVLRPSYNLADRIDSLLKRHSLAIFISAQQPAVFAMNDEVEEEVIASDRFHINPLLQLIAKNRSYYILTLSRGASRLLEADLQSVRLVDVNLPQGVEAVVGDRSDEERFAAVNQGSFGQAYFNMVPTMNKQQVDVKAYCRAVDERVTRFLNGKKAPLMLAGLSTIQSRFRDISKYKHLLSEGITTNPDRLSNERLHQRSIEKVREYIAEKEGQISDQYFQLAATQPNKTSSAIEEIISAAYDGRVEYLLVKPKAHLWGMYDENLDDIAVHSNYQPGDHDLIDLAAQATFAHSGQVVTLRDQDGQSAPTLAAILRW